MILKLLNYVMNSEVSAAIKLLERLEETESRTTTLRELIVY